MAEFAYEDMLPLGPDRTRYRVTDACAAHGGFYLGMEAVWRIEVEDLPAFIVVDDKGHDSFATVTTPFASTIPVRPGA